MSDNRKLMEGQLERYEGKLTELNSYIKELNEMTAKHGTPNDQIEEDLTEAQYNAEYYEDEVARLRQELGGLPKPRTQVEADTILPQTTKQGLGALTFSLIGFVAGLLIGSALESRRGGGDREP